MPRKFQLELLAILGEPCQLAECALWDWRTATFWWTDIEGRKLCAWVDAAAVEEVYAMPERLTAFGLTETSFVGAFASGFAFFTADGVRSPVLPVEPDNPGTRMNDGRVDRSGVFWAGTMVEHADRATGPGALYRLDEGIRSMRVHGDVSISNGLCWDETGTWMYFADSPTGLILRAHADGPLSFRPFARALDKAHPDGATVDAEGCLWSAQWGSGCIVRYRSDGAIDGLLDIPCPQPTCVAFGGPAMSWLFVTTARAGLGSDVLARFPDSGRVFVYRTPFAGVRETVCGARSSHGL